MGERWKPVLIGVAAGVLVSFIPDGPGTLVLVVAALAAGWVLPEEPLVAALLFLGPAIIIRSIQALVADGPSQLGKLAIALVFTIMFVAIFTMWAQA